MNAIDFIDVFDRESTNFRLLDDYNDLLYEGNGRRCMAWLMKNNQYDIYPEDGGIWAKTESDGTITILLTESFE